MMSLLIKLNCLSRKTEPKQYILKVQKRLIKEGMVSMNWIASAYADDIISIIGFDMNMPYPEKQVINIIKVYEKFSEVSGLSNNASKRVYGLTREKEDNKAKKIMESLVKNFGAEVDNF